MKAAYWYSADKSGSYDMGVYPEAMTDDSIRDSVYDELVAQCTDEAQESAIMAGYVTITGKEIE